MNTRTWCELFVKDCFEDDDCTYYYWDPYFREAVISIADEEQVKLQEADIEFIIQLLESGNVSFYEKYKNKYDFDEDFIEKVTS